MEWRPCAREVRSCAAANRSADTYSPSGSGGSAASGTQLGLSCAARELRPVRGLRPRPVVQPSDRGQHLIDQAMRLRKNVLIAAANRAEDELGDSSGHIFFYATHDVVAIAGNDGAAGIAARASLVHSRATYHGLVFPPAKTISEASAIVVIVYTPTFFN